MTTKIMAAEIAADAGIRTVIINGGCPSYIYDVLEGAEIGTYFDIRG
jgi:glutamate 5-kinase